MSDASRILDLLVHPKTGLGALSAKLDAHLAHCIQVHLTLDRRVEDLEDAQEAGSIASARANGQRAGRVETIMAIAKIVAFLGIGGGGVGLAVQAAVALMRMLQ